MISARELEILKLIAAGYTNFKISTKLNISEYTVETHRKNMNNKLGASNTAMLLEAARKKGWL